MIADYLSALPANTQVYYCSNAGNGGDTLIAQATFQIFRALQIDYCVIDRETFTPAGQIVIYSGGGNLTRYYNHARDFIARVHRDVGKLILLPHTIEGNQDLLASFGNNVDIICREETSYAHVRQHAKQANVFLMDDMAFSLHTAEVLHAPLAPYWCRSTTLVLLVEACRRRESFRQMLAYWPARLMKPRVLNCFRTDVERTGTPLPAYNLDVSDFFGYGKLGPEKTLLYCHHFLRIVDAYPEIKTNRLHVAIAGALLGRQVWLYPNSYYKNQAIFDFSLRTRFPNVHWMGV